MNSANAVPATPATMSIKDWQGKRVWVIGASSGIGKAFAENVASLGAEVYISARSAQKLAEVAKASHSITALPLEATDAAAVQTAYATVTKNGKLDLLLHAAALYEPMRAWNMHAETIERAMQVNYGSVIKAVDTVLPDMLNQQSGHIAIIASVAGYMGMPNSLAYGPTKAALINLSENLYADLYSKGVAVHVINPGFVKSPLTDKNNFEMPSIITPEQAAEYMVSGFASGNFEITFPKRFTYTLKLVERLPYGLKLPLLRRLSTGSNKQTVTNSQ